MRYFLVSTLICAAMLSCSVSPIEQAGGSTSTPNEVVMGYAVFPDGAPAARTKVQLIPSTYAAIGNTESSTLPTDTTDATGAYKFTYVDTGTYNIQALHLETRKRSLVTGIVANIDTVLAPPAVLKPAGNLVVILPESPDLANGHLLIPGTTIAVSVDGTRDTLVLDSVPAGFISEIAYASATDTTASTIRYNVRVTSGDDAVIRNPSWKYARMLGLNTSPTGANIAGNVTDFPVLVRLNDDNFDFSQAQTSGADIRFTKSDNCFFKHEIERWDPVAELAEVWVNVDTVLGNDGTQSIMMYWGNPDAVDSSNGTAVFDTANGFAGVWHLDEDEEIVHDATANGYVGTRFGNQSRTDGTIGYGQTYADSGDYTDMGNVLNPGTANFTVSAWIKRFTSGETYTIIGKSNGGAPQSNYGWLMTFSFGYLRFFMISEGEDWGDTGTFGCEAGTELTDTSEWHFVAAVIDRSENDNCRLFINGVDVTNDRVGDITGVGSVTNQVNLRIGIEADDGFPIQSHLDEVTVSYTARSVDWIKLCYMNQRSGNKLVEFK